MPFYDKTDDEKGIFKQYNKDVLPELIMPAGEGSEKKNFISRVMEDKGLDPERREKCIELYKKIRQMVIDYNQANGITKPIDECITWQDNVFSEGGSHKGKKLLLYLVIHVNDIVILEPVNEYANATYIFKNDEYLEWNLKKTRGEIIDENLGHKIAHEENKRYTDYNYDNPRSNIIRILNAVLHDKDRFLKDIKPEEGKDYCNARKVFRKRDVRDIINEYGITYLDLAEVVKRYSNDIELPIEERELVGAVEDMIDDDNAEKSNLYQKLKNYIPRSNASQNDDLEGGER